MKKKLHPLFIALISILTITLSAVPVSAATVSNHSSNSAKNVSVIGEGIPANKTVSANSLANLFKQKKQFSLAALTDLTAIQPRVVTACPYGNGIHDMVSAGYGWVYDNSGHPMFTGCAWQCSKCYDVMVTEYDPLVINYIGRYTEQHINYKIAQYGCAIYTNPSNVFNCNSAHIAGYTFRDAG